ncbi:hypothetical protein PsYK624_159370 [Phanerochaete sordida]|uniref:Uncharacterized protein n=1 Tax=Phanerochaete sordida TaxID=48140 RepID=A0A9P3GR76_9APHY|nr:hypothetical protein PsYK624_159370 [Phanerochaete sordida]
MSCGTARQIARWSQIASTDTVALLGLLNGSFHFWLLGAECHGEVAPSASVPARTRAREGNRRWR